jgi:hypothetical protein
MLTVMIEVKRKGKLKLEVESVVKGRGIIERSVRQVGMGVWV